MEKFVIVISVQPCLCPPIKNNNIEYIFVIPTLLSFDKIIFRFGNILFYFVRRESKASARETRRIHRSVKQGEIK